MTSHKSENIWVYENISVYFQALMYKCDLNTMSKPELAHL